MYDKFSIENLDKEQREIAETIGMEAYIKLSKMYGGITIYVGKIDKLKNLTRDKKIVKEYNGYNANILAKKYKISSRYVQRIIEKNNTSNQITLFDGEDLK